MRIPSEKTKGSESGCFTAVWTIFWSITFISAIIFCIVILQPVAVKLIEPSFCNGKIVHVPSAKRKSIICIDSKTGKSRNISHLQIFACCPTVFLMTFLIIVLIIASAVLRKNRNWVQWAKLRIIRALPCRRAADLIRTDVINGRAVGYKINKACA